MKLLYLYVRDGSYFNPMSVSFDGAYQFSYRESEKRVDLKLDETRRLDDFFYSVVEDRKAKVDVVSAVVGENGAGKTSIARYLQKIRLHDGKDPTTFDYILIFEVQGVRGERVWIARWYISNELLLENEKIGLPQAPEGVVWAASDLPFPPGLCKEFDLVYFSPHFTTESPFIGNSYIMSNLSTNGLMFENAEYDLGRLVERGDQELVVMNYAVAEHRRVLQFLATIREFEQKAERQKAGQPAFRWPEKIKIRFNESVFEEAEAWVVAQKMSIENDLRGLAKSEKETDQNRADQLKGELARVKVLDNAIGWIKAPLGSEKRNLFLRAFVLFVLNLSRQSNVFSFANDLHNQWYARCLIRVLDEVVRPRVVAGDKKLGPEFYSLIIKSLKNCIERRPGPGVPVENGNVWRPRRSAVRLFELLCEMTNDKGGPNEQSRIEDLTFPTASTEVLVEFINNYVESKQKFDYLAIDFDPVLSSGEMSYLTLFARLFEFFTLHDKNREYFFKHHVMGPVQPFSPPRTAYSNEILLFLDEAETTLHPDWQRQLVWNMIWFLETFAREDRVHVIFASHSPMLLSDVPLTNAIFMERAKETEGATHIIAHCQQLDGRSTGVDTFAANAYDLFRYSFFMMSGPVGRFACEKLNKVLRETAEVARRIAIGDAVSQDERMEVGRRAGLFGDPTMRKYFDGLRTVGLL